MAGAALAATVDQATHADDIADLEAANLEFLTRVQRIEEDVAVLIAARLAGRERAILGAVAEVIRP